MTTAIWKGKAGEIRGILERLALPNGKECLFNPLPLMMVPGALSVRAQSSGKTSFLIADIAHEGIEVAEHHSVSVDASELLKFLALYDAGTEVTVTFADPITIEGGGRSCKVHPEATSAAPLGSAIPVFENGLLKTKDGRTATTTFTVDTGLLMSLVADARTIDVPAFPIEAKTDGLHVSLGGLEAKKNSIRRHLAITVEGTEAKTTIGEDLVAVLNHSTGALKLQMFTHAKPHPLTVESGAIRYVLLPRVV